MKYRNLDASPQEDLDGYPQYIHRDSRDVIVYDTGDLKDQDTGILNRNGVRIYRTANEIGFGRN